MQDSESKKGLRHRLLNPKALIIIALVTLITGAGAGVGLFKASENPAFCKTCHIIKPYYESWKQGDLLAHKHAAAESNVKCLDCHDKTITEKAQEGLNYATGNYNEPLRGSPGTREVCLSCHTGKERQGFSWDEIKAATDFEESNPHDSHHGEQNCNLCHSIHKQSTPMCVGCHQFKWFDDLDAGWNTE